MSDQASNDQASNDGVHLIADRARFLQATAEALAQSSGLAASKILSILERTFVGFDRNVVIDDLQITAVTPNDQERPLDETSNVQATIEFRPIFAPDLADALASLPPAVAIEAFESANLTELADRVAWMAYLTDETTPFYTLGQLSDHLNAFADHLVRNRSELMQTGYPRTNFTQSIWLDWHLGRTYFVKLPLDIQVAGHEGENLVMSYAWPDQPLERFGDGALSGGAQLVGLDSGHWRAEDGTTYTLGGKPLRACPYEDAALIAGLDPPDAHRLDTMREKVLDLKIKVLRVLAQHLRRRDSQRLWPSCLDLLTAALSTDEVDCCLRLDHFFTGFDIHTGTGVKSQDYLNAGGLTDLLMVMGHCANELAIGTLDLAKRLLDPLPPIASYYAAVGQSWQANLDEALDQVRALQSRESAQWSAFRVQVNDALENEFFEEVTIRIPVRRKLARKFELEFQHYAEWRTAQLELGGMPPEIQLSNPASVSVTPPLTGSEHQEGNMFRRQGSQWSIQYQGKVVTIRHTKGAAYLAHLLYHPGQDIHVLALVRAVEGTEMVTDQPAATALAKEWTNGRAQNSATWTDTGPLLDAQAEKEYRRALHELQQKSEEADRCGDEHLSRQIHEEMEAIAQQMKAAFGLGGRHRRSADPAERARINVRKLILGTIKRIASVSPALADHLRTSIRTGSSCSYAPVEPVPWAS